MKLSPTAILARRFYCWRRRNISPQIFGCLLAVTVGAGAGVAAHTLKWCIARLSEMLTAHMRFGGPNYEFLVLPLAGIVLTFVFTRYVLHRDLEDGTERLTATLKSRRTRLPFRLIFTPIIANTLTLGFGGSAGSRACRKFGSHSLQHWALVPALAPGGCAGHGMRRRSRYSGHLHGTRRRHILRV